MTLPPGQADQSSLLQLPRRLEELRASLDGSNPGLYRHLALYLQVLREVLPCCVERALFHLATEVSPERYAALPPSRRRKLHRRQAALVQRCCSLLTVEQLACLAARIQRERLSRGRQQRQRLLERLAEGQQQPVSPSASDSSSSGLADLAPQPQAPEAYPPGGSVHLGFSLPLSGGLFGWDGLDLLPAPLERPSTGPSESSPPQPRDPFQPLAGENPARHGSGSAAPSPEGQPDQASPPLEDPADLLEAFAELLSGRAEHGGSEPPPAGPWDSGGLPRDPLLLLRWLEGFELALTRRLRNLSHALNVELLRLGLAPALLPVSLLDAVLAGQLDTLPAPANLVHLRLPLGLPGSAPPLHALAVLLRAADLELEQPRLRSCRRRLQQQQQELRRMAEQFRRLQRRLQSHEAQQLWLQDIQPPID